VKLLRIIDLPQPLEEVHYVDADGNDQVVAIPSYEYTSVEHQKTLESIWRKSVPLLEEIFPMMAPMNALDHIGRIAQSYFLCVVDDLGLPTPLTPEAFTHPETQLATPIDKLVKSESSEICKGTRLEHVGESKFRKFEKL
jgi:hypothetical protein